MKRVIKELPVEESLKKIYMNHGPVAMACPSGLEECVELDEVCGCDK
ncbi:hypothetical protein THOM_1910 [Trachipleistophora hominis]|uniref:Uncharacterized protein n=1 Tax=Trachipleistophora hominis TaxID=72359 RepID=L7JUP8_TRAHO|nr:hypothetical protein THOM_1910 [Trachipleistophora hominis]